MQKVKSDGLVVSFLGHLPADIAAHTNDSEERNNDEDNISSHRKLLLCKSRAHGRVIRKSVGKSASAVCDADVYVAEVSAASRVQ